MPRRNRQKKRQNQARIVQQPRVASRALQPVVREKVILAPVQEQYQITNLGKPQMRGTKSGDIVVAHREYFADITTTNDFTNRRWVINAGNPAMFPWLSNLAHAYERYRFRRLTFEVRTGSGTGSNGRVGIFIDFDCADPAPQNKAQAYSNRNAVDGPVWTNLAYTALPTDLQRLKSYYVASDGAIVVTDTVQENLKDTGILNVFTSLDTTPQRSELFVSYEVELMTPSPAAPPIALVAYLTTGANGVASNMPFGDTDAHFEAGVDNESSSNILAWDTPSTLRFVTPFIGQLMLSYTGTAIVTPIPDQVADATHCSATADYNQLATTLATQVFQIVANQGDLFSAVGLAATTIVSMYIRAYSPGVQK